ncbi:hypothetical protein R3W88_018832 [Solanum pinnatisectum]|uniref:Uncharacterized protein n=1 Tax=Solanum pinnatisectum TaxID=50273 RepID=A0AAV9KKK0_9SOLN|nr:hypothetical protein R3W88_018832 [Solanum pinnatisectum]
MVLRFSIDRIMTDILIGFCGVQIMDMSRERESLEKKNQISNFDFEDEEEHVFQPSINVRNAKKLMSLNTSKVEMKPSVIESESSSVELSVEPPRPTKNL